MSFGGLSKSAEADGTVRVPYYRCDGCVAAGRVRSDLYPGHVDVTHTVLELGLGIYYVAKSERFAWKCKACGSNPKWWSDVVKSVLYYVCESNSRWLQVCGRMPCEDVMFASVGCGDEHSLDPVTDEVQSREVDMVDEPDGGDDLPSVSYVKVSESAAVSAMVSEAGDDDRDESSVYGDVKLERGSATDLPRIGSLALAESKKTSSSAHRASRHSGSGGSAKVSESSVKKVSKR